MKKHTLPFLASALLATGCATQQPGQVDVVAEPMPLPAPTQQFNSHTQKILSPVFGPCSQTDTDNGSLSTGYLLRCGYLLPENAAQGYAVADKRPYADVYAVNTPPYRTDETTECSARVIFVRPDGRPNAQLVTDPRVLATLGPGVKVPSGYALTAGPVYQAGSNTPYSNALTCVQAKVIVSPRFTPNGTR